MIVVLKEQVLMSEIGSSLSLQYVRDIRYRWEHK